MLVSAQEAAEVRDYVLRLNSAKNDGMAVAVEGRRDADALRRLGYAGTILEFHRFGGLGNFVDHAAKYESVVVLFDGDRKGRHLTGRVARQLERRTNVDLSLRRRLWRITRGRITFIEQLACYEHAVAMLLLQQ